MHEPVSNTVTLKNSQLEMTAIWPHFTINDYNQRKAGSKLCYVIILRGSTTAVSYNTSNLMAEKRVWLCG